MPESWLVDVVRRCLDEDLGGAPGRDVTTGATVGPTATGAAQLVAREPGVFAGSEVLRETLEQVCGRFGLAPAVVELACQDGDTFAAGQVLAEVRAPTMAILMAERTALNLLSRACGIATHTRAWVAELAGTGAEVLDTRKTTPGLRALEKYAVRCGGGRNKRMGLHDVAMIKDNHLVAAGSVAAAIAAVRASDPEVSIEVEADTLEQAMAALDAGARFLLLDNMPVPVLEQVVRAVRDREGETGRVELEATGGLTLSQARAVAATGVDYLSVGALTHSSPALDLGLDLIGSGREH